MSRDDSYCHEIFDLKNGGGSLVNELDHHVHSLFDVNNSNGLSNMEMDCRRLV